MHRIRYTLSLILGTILISPTTAPPVVAQEQDAGHCPGRLEALNVSYRQQLREIERRYLPETVSGTDHRNGVSFDQQDGSAVGGCTRYDVIGAYADAARHAAKSAESGRTRNRAWQSWARTGRPGVRAC